MSQQNTTLPSGRPVGSARKDAKKLAANKNIPLHRAFDIIAAENGVASGWAAAMTQVGEAAKQSQPVSLLLSFTSLALFDAQKEAKAVRKASGADLNDEILRQCELRGIAFNPKYRNGFLFPVEKGEFHRICFENTLLVCKVTDFGLYVIGYDLDKCLKRNAYSRRGDVVLSFMGGIVHFKRNVTSCIAGPPSFWICKYSSGSGDLCLDTESVELANAIGDELGLEVFYASRQKSLYEGKVFSSLKEWAKRYQNLAKGRSDDYAGKWGDWALGLSERL